MTPGEIGFATRVLGKPEGWDGSQGVTCLSLAIRDAVDVAGNPVMQSKWVPSREERAAIAAGGDVIVTVWGTMHPPIDVEVSDPGVYVV